KTSFDFMINASFLSAGSALLLLLLGLASPGALAGEWLPWAMEVAVFAAGAYLFYLGSISRAAGWGATVKSAFDLYRGKLLDQLGFKQKPGSMLGERALWEAISRQMIYGDPPAHVGSPPAYGGPSSPSARGKPSVAELRVTRAMASAPPGRTRVMLRVGNPDKERDVKGVVVTDVVPEGHLYLWGSARAAGEPVQVTGSNPYRFELGTVPAGSEVVLEYRYVQPGK
ncbi:MAG TPA: hypothetical protein VFX98_11395, partial [Longimicrobiaceae bacterium]|nr:hypothetical protein [Longimicrobiaceae bacterium]